MTKTRVSGLSTVFMLIMMMLYSYPAPILAADDFDSLRAEIVAANRSSSRSISLSGDIVLAAPLPAITGRVTIDGGGHTISGDDAHRIFDVNGGALALSNVTLTDGKATEGEGGAIRLRNGAVVTIERSTLSANSATHGGAIAMVGGRLSISDSSLSGNNADDSGGAIYANGGTVSIADSSLVKNCAVSISGITNYHESRANDLEEQDIDSDGCLHITYHGSRHETSENLEGEGGAIRLFNGARVIVETSSFSENKATTGGAVASSRGSVELTVDRSSFVSNESSSIAGAIMSDAGSTAISNSSFEKNVALITAGAVAVKNDRLEIANSTFSENHTELGAGALVVVFPSATAFITHATFRNNWSLYGHGSTIDNGNGGKLYLRNSIVVSRGRGEDCVGGFTQNIGNISRDGSCAIRASEDLRLGDLSGAPAYHPLLDHSPAIDAADPVFCTETDQIGTARPVGGGCDSGAIEATTAEAAAAPIVPPPVCGLADEIIAANTDRAVAGCQAGSGADTIRLTRDILLFSRLPAITSFITIEGNGHTISGNSQFRIFDVDGGHLTVNNLTMTEGQTSSGSGGAIRLQNGARAVVNDSQFVRNLADAGGAIGLDSSYGAQTRFTVNRSSFVRNRALQEGGAIDLNFGSAVISNSSFINNSAEYRGGAIHLRNYPKVEVSNSSFLNNRSSVGGNALAAENGAQATLTHVTVYNHVMHGAGTAIHIFFPEFGERTRISMRNSLISGSPHQQHCVGELTQNVGNIIHGGACSPMLSDDPLLEEATDATTFLSPLPGSPAIDAANPTFCPETDQLGRARSIVGRCDIGAIEAVPVSQALSNCSVTTTHTLNFRDGPSGKIIGGVPQGAALSVKARTPRWFQVEHEGKSGWISADYVVAEGSCG